MICPSRGVRRPWEFESKNPAAIDCRIAAPARRRRRTQHRADRVSRRENAAQESIATISPFLDLRAAVETGVTNHVD
jgi:hypothetical protein